MIIDLIIGAILAGWVATTAMFIHALREWRHTLHTEQHHNPNPSRDTHETKGDPS